MAGARPVKSESSEYNIHFKFKIMLSERITVKILAILLFGSVAFFTSCDSSGNYDNEKSAEQPTGEDLVAKGKAVELMKQQCFSCHSPRGGEHNRVAPPMIAIKRHYLEEGDSDGV